MTHHRLVDGGGLATSTERSNSDIAVSPRFREAACLRTVLSPLCVWSHAVSILMVLSRAGCDVGRVLVLGEDCKMGDRLCLTSVLLESPLLARSGNTRPKMSKLSVVNVDQTRLPTSCKSSRTQGPQPLAVMCQQEWGYQRCKAQTPPARGIPPEICVPLSPRGPAPQMSSWPMVPSLFGCCDFLRKCLKRLWGLPWNRQSLSYFLLSVVQCLLS